LHYWDNVTMSANVTMSVTPPCYQLARLFDRCLRSCRRRKPPPPPLPRDRPLFEECNDMIMIKLNIKFNILFKVIANDYSY
jgi:hypothetical protein